MEPLTWLLLSSVAMSAKTAHTAGKTQEIEIERQAEQEKMSAEARELQRRQQLNKVLAANTVGLVTSGMSGEGTPASISLESAKQASASEGLEALSDRLRQAQLKRQASSAGSTGVQMASTLLEGGVQAAMLNKPQKKGG